MLKFIVDARVVSVPPGTGAVHFGPSVCTGDEESIFDCIRLGINFFFEDCFGDAGVICECES